MRITKPLYYDRFSCIAGACPDSCCHEWAVDVDEETAARYRALPGALGDRLREVLQDTEDGTVMAICEGRCPMWREDGLCRIQAELGHGALCKTCQTFPRLTHDYGDFVEKDLELSCPEAARLIFSGDDAPVSREVPGGAGEYDREIMAILLQSRETALKLLREPTLSVPQRLATLLIYGYEVQYALDGGELAPGLPELPELPAGEGDTARIFAFFRELELLTDRWKMLLEAGPTAGSWDSRLVAVARYLIRRYWLQAVSDYDLVSRVKLIVTGCILLNALQGDLLQTAQLFSKEIENDPDNVEALLDGAYTAPALTDANLLHLLIG